MKNDNLVAEIGVGISENEPRAGSTNCGSEWVRRRSPRRSCAEQRAGLPSWLSFSLFFALLSLREKWEKQREKKHMRAKKREACARKRKEGTIRSVLKKYAFSYVKAS